MLEFYRLQQLAHQKGLLRDKYRYRVLPEPPTPKVEGSRDLSLPGPCPKHVSRREFQQRLPVAKYGPFREMYWENDLTARPEDRVETESSKDQPSTLTPQKDPAAIEDASPPPSPTVENNPGPADRPEEKTYVEADEEITEPE